MNTTELESGYIRNDEGLKIFYQVWLPETPKGILQIFHGFGEHSSRYKHVVNQLVKDNWLIIAHDHRGHGKSEGMRNHVDDFDQFVKDGRLVTDQVKEKYANLPLFLLGHSMGSYIALKYAIQNEAILSGLILSGTGAEYKADAFTVFMGKLLAKLFPKMMIPSGLDPNGISSDQAEVEAYKNDPLVNYKKSSAKLGLSFITTYKEIEEQLKDLSLPLLVQYGKQDQVGFVNRQKILDDFGSEDKTLLAYEGAAHEVYNERKTLRKKAITDLHEWLNDHLK